jgi:hypothetical protein
MFGLVFCLHFLRRRHQSTGWDEKRRNKKIKNELTFSMYYGYVWQWKKDRRKKESKKRGRREKKRNLGA